MAADKHPAPWFQDFDHALKMGFLAGTLVRAGIPFTIERDAVGNYKPFIQLVILEEGEIEPVRIMVQVMPDPPPGGGDE